jgi:hypothetical protein
MDSNENGLIDYFGNFTYFIILGEFTAVSLEYDLYAKTDNLYVMFSFLSDNKPSIDKDALFKLMQEDFHLNRKWNEIAIIAYEN